MDTPSPLRSLLAGCMAGGIEIACTYPAEFAKTRMQLSRQLRSVRTSENPKWPPFGREWYAGCSSAIAGNSAKVAVRFLAYEQIKSLLQDENGNLSTPRSMIAGLGAGLLESVIAVTPSESVKTFAIEDRNSAKPRTRGTADACTLILRERGFRGLMQGLVPTSAKQAANSAVRFTSYSHIKTMMQKRLSAGERLDSKSTFAAGAAAGVITVYATQPLDTVKTRMQGRNARQEYKHSLDAVAKIVRKGGVSALWAGSVPRMIRLMLSGGIVFTAYENIVVLLGRFNP